MKGLLDVTDLGTAGLARVLDLAEADIDDLGHPLAGRGVALIFEKPSNRTRQSVEMAVVQLGGHPVYTRSDEVGFGERETVEDVARVMSGYHAMLGARVFDHTVVERLAAAATVPVVNMLSDWSHPLQAVADVLTMRQVHGYIESLQVAWVGDWNNVSRSLAEACVLAGADVRVASPAGYGIDDAELERIDGLGSGSVRRLARAIEAVGGADAVHTDTWVSMGQEAEAATRGRAFEAFAVDATLMAAAASGAGFYHCLPAHRGMEVAAEVIDGPASHVFAQAHNRMHAARGVLAHLAGVI